jgi:hypothetical protein
MSSTDEPELPYEHDPGDDEPEGDPESMEGDDEDRR